MDVGIRVLRFESFEEGWETTKVRPSHIPRRERVFGFPQPANIIQFIESPEKSEHKHIATQKNCKNQPQVQLHCVYPLFLAHNVQAPLARSVFIDVISHALHVVHVTPYLVFFLFLFFDNDLVFFLIIIIIILVLCQRIFSTS